MSELPHENNEKLEKLIAEAKASGGSELANYGIFIDRLCEALDLPRPQFASEENQYNDYVLERRVDFKRSCPISWCSSWLAGSFRRAELISLSELQAG